MPQFVYGDSFGDVANRERGYNEDMFQRLFQSLAANRANRQQSFNEQAASSDAQFRMQQALAQQAQQRQAMDQQRRAEQFNMMQFLANKQLSERELGVREGNAGNKQFQEAAGLAETGGLTPEQVKANYKLTPQHYSIIESLVMNKRNQENQHGAASEAIAANLNARIKSMRELAAFRLANTEATKEGKHGLFRSNATPEEILKAANEKLDKMKAEDKLPPLSAAEWASQVEMVTKNPQYGQRVVPDETSQAFKPAPFARMFQQQAAAPSPTTPQQPSGPPQQAMAQQAIAQMMQQAKLSPILSNVTPGATKTQADAAAIQALKGLGYSIDEAAQMVVNAKRKKVRQSDASGALQYNQMAAPVP